MGKKRKLEAVAKAARDVDYWYRATQVGNACLPVGDRRTVHAHTEWVKARERLTRSLVAVFGPPYMTETS